jgi:hypothetical protein
MTSDKTLQKCGISGSKAFSGITYAVMYREGAQETLTGGGV